MTSGIFFQRCTAPTAGTHALDVPGQQLLAAARHGACIKAQQLGNADIAAMTGLECLKTSVVSA